MPASSSSQFSIGVVSTAKFGANVAAPPVKFQLVDAPISRMAADLSLRKRLREGREIGQMRFVHEQVRSKTERRTLLRA